MRSEKLRQIKVRGAVAPILKAKMWASRLIDEVDGKNSVCKPKICSKLDNDSICTAGLDKPNCEPLPTPPPLQKQREGNWCIIGTDVESLFPSLADLESAKIVRHAIKNSKIEFNNIDYKLGLRYLKIVCGNDYLKEIGLGHVIPSWRGKRQDLLSIGGELSKEDGNWIDVKRDLLL